MNKNMSKWKKLAAGKPTKVQRELAVIATEVIRTHAEMDRYLAKAIAVLAASIKAIDELTPAKCVPLRGCTSPKLQKPASDERNRWLELANVKNPTSEQFLEAVRLLKSKPIIALSKKGLLNSMPWIPFYWHNKYGTKGTFADFVASSIHTGCGICNKPLGFTDRSDHNPHEHSHCHEAVSQSCLG